MPLIRGLLKHILPPHAFCSLKNKGGPRKVQTDPFSAHLPQSEARIGGWRRLVGWFVPLLRIANSTPPPPVLASRLSPFRFIGPMAISHRSPQIGRYGACFSPFPIHGKNSWTIDAQTGPRHLLDAPLAPPRNHAAQRMRRWPHGLSEVGKHARKSALLWQ